MKREAELKAAFNRELKMRLPGFVSIRLLDAGAPDRAIAGGGVVTFIEFKHGTPAFDSPGNQELFCMRLDVAARCRYVIWQENLELIPQTLIASPRAVHARGNGWHIEAEKTFAGFEHFSVVEWLRRRHFVR